MLFQQDTLARALKSIVTLVPKRSTIPIIENVLFEPTDNGVAIAATDLITHVRVIVPAIDAFATCLPARPLLEFVRALERDAEVSLSLHGATVRVTGAGARLELPVRPTVEFPARMQHVGSAFDVEDPDSFLEALGWVARAIGHDDARPQLTGLFFDGDGLVATDGHRLHKATLDGLACPRALVPANAVAFVLRALRGDKIGISVGEKTVRFESSMWTVTTRQVDAAFPPYEQVIPKGAVFTMKVSTSALETGLKRVARPGSTRDVRPITVRANGAIKIESGNSDAQLASTIGVIDSTHEGDDHVQGFNARYISEAIVNSDDLVTLRFQRADDPIVIETDSRVAVVMPFRV